MTDLVDDFITAACVPRQGAHVAGAIDAANAMLAAHPGIADSGIHVAAILGDDAGVRRCLAADPASATATGGPYGWDALTHLCFSNYLKLDRSQDEGFVRAATALLDAGASANTGWWETDHQPKPEWEPVLYGAAGVAHHPGLTALLLERGANPNDVEVAYHSPETHDNRCLALLVGSGRMTADNLSMMLIRKHDWHDVDGARYLLEHGADPNHPWGKGFLAMHHAIARDNVLPMFELLLDHGADPTLTLHGRSAIAKAAWSGRGDVLALFRRRGIPIALEGVDTLIAACASNDSGIVRSIAVSAPALVAELRAAGGELLARFSLTGNADGVRQLLDLGVDVATPWTEGDPYFGIPKGSLAIHVAAWRGRHATVRLLLERGSPADVPDASGQTPLMLAVRACVDSYWMARRTPESVAALLAAGADARRITVPTGYAEIDSLLSS